MSTASGYRGASVLVTGAQGFIGSWLAGRLLSEDARVIAPLRPAAEGSRFRREGLDRECELVEMDLLDLQSLLRVLNERDVRVVFHLAAETIVAEGNSSPVPVFDTNLRGTYNLLEAARLLGGRGAGPRLVLASSCHAYGKHEGGASSEDARMRPSDPYHTSKACADMVARSYAATYGMPLAVTRLANTYGGGDFNWSRIVPDTARALIRGEPPVITSDGTLERDYLYVEDAVDAYLMVARSLEDPGFHGRAWTVGLGHPVSDLELVRTLIAVSGRDVEPDIRGEAVPHAETEPEHLDFGAIRDELGWSARRDLEEALAATYAWYEENLN